MSLSNPPKVFPKQKWWHCCFNDADCQAWTGPGACWKITEPRPMEKTLTCAMSKCLSTPRITAGPEQKLRSPEGFFGHHFWENQWCSWSLVALRKSSNLSKNKTVHNVYLVMSGFQTLKSRAEIVRNNMTILQRFAILTETFQSPSSPEPYWIHRCRLRPREGDSA